MINWFQHIEFANVWVLPFLLMLPVIAWMHYRMLRSLKSAFTVTTTTAFKQKTYKSYLVHLPFGLRLLAAGCIIVAIARPQIKNVQRQTKGEGIDIVLSIDVSGSMLSKDFYPNRLEVAKEMAAEFVRQRPVDQIGLVIFSGESYTLFPVSTDHTSLVEQIRNLRSGMLEDGTLIGEGLATSVDRLRPSRARSKVIVLLTDGKEQPPENRLIDPITALEIAKTEGVKVYTIGMAAEEGATVVEKGVAGRPTVAGGLDEALLRRIAMQTGGAYFRAIDKQSLQDIYQRIDKLEKSDVEVTSKTRFEEQFIYFIAAALALLVLEMLLRFILLRPFP
ncbi:VWA domain-containing protein [Chitinophagaceae bacterium LB-8]|uniref:VWA domain-containing protein n=1 Tax=Paraflavisolibacter caeni TaxID=2982496 RepID=A0A9X3BH68_9BACT|nr:VWA domain-containing protein [Paraflavisolibacter caeni]MCU7548543.1 VWA domain-containing protein [Paraflavisolibacter caeni]